MAFRRSPVRSWSGPPNLHSQPQSAVSSRKRVRLRRFQQSRFRPTKFRPERTVVGTAGAARATPAPTGRRRAAERVLRTPECPLRRVHRVGRRAPRSIRASVSSSRSFSAWRSWLVHFFPVSMIFTSGPREIFAMNPCFECRLHRRDILSKADKISAAASSPVRDDDVMLKNRSLAAMTACFSSWLYRIRSSRVMTIQPLKPASRSQTTSSVP